MNFYKSVSWQWSEGKQEQYSLNSSRTTHQSVGFSVKWMEGDSVLSPSVMPDHKRKCTNLSRCIAERRFHSEWRLQAGFFCTEMYWVNSVFQFLNRQHVYFTPLFKLPKHIIFEVNVPFLSTTDKILASRSIHSFFDFLYQHHKKYLKL
jgi:hypothetical protein